MVWHVIVEFLVQKSPIVLECISTIDDFVAGDYRPRITTLSHILLILFGLGRELWSGLFFSDEEGHLLSFETNNAFSEDGIFEQIFQVDSSIGNPDTIVVHQHIGLFL
jgi:hypothetical protein